MHYQFNSQKQSLSACYGLIDVGEKRACSNQVKQIVGRLTKGVSGKHQRGVLLASRGGKEGDVMKGTAGFTV